VGKENKKGKKEEKKYRKFPGSGICTPCVQESGNKTIY
jgi:hypothetical protein